MSLTRQIARIGLWMAGTSALLFWISHHAEVSSADGLRYIREAQQIHRGDLAGGLLRSTDHPLHPLAIAGAHAVLDGEGPYAWQTAAQVIAALALVLAVAPFYLLCRELFDDDTAFLAVPLVFAHPVVSYIAVNVLSESTFLLFWLWGLWAAVRFLREGRFIWLLPAVGAGALAYLTRPEGLLLHLALASTLLLLPLRRSTRIVWPRWCAALALLVIGPALLVGPYIAARGGLGTKPAVARVMGILPETPAEALEREQPRPPGQTILETYATASSRAAGAFVGMVAWPLIPLAVLGLIVACPGPERSRLRLFSGVILAASAAGLIRLHATGGYCAARHALIPGLLVLPAAANGLAWLARKATIEARWLGPGAGRWRPGPALILGCVVAMGGVRPLAPSGSSYDSSFAAYRQAGAWIEGRPDADGRVIDLTDWSLFFSNRHGLGLAAADQATARPGSRWVVVREANLKDQGRSGALARALVEGRDPVARFPESPTPGRSRICVYDLDMPALDGLAIGSLAPVRR